MPSQTAFESWMDRHHGLHERGHVVGQLEVVAAKQQGGPSCQLARSEKREVGLGPIELAMKAQAFSKFLQDHCEWMSLTPL